MIWCPCQICRHTCHSRHGREHFTPRLPPWAAVWAGSGALAYHPHREPFHAHGAGRGAFPLQRGKSPLLQGLRPQTSVAFVGGRGRTTERMRPAACGGTQESASVRTTASIAFVWSSAQPPPRLPLYAGQCPTTPSSPRGRKESFQKGNSL